MTLNYSLLSESEAKEAKERVRQKSMAYIRFAASQRRGGMTSNEYWRKVSDKAKVDDIISAVSKTHRGAVLVGRWINKRRLREDIQSAFETYDMHRLADDRPLGKLRRERLLQFARHSSALLRVLSPDVYDDREGQASTIARSLLAPYFPPYEGYYFEVPESEELEKAVPKNERGSASLSGLIDALVRLERTARELADKRYADDGANKHAGQLVVAPDAILRQSQNAGDALIGIYLARVYEKWFHDTSGAGRPSPARQDSSLPADGPYIRFVTDVLDDLRGQGRQSPQYTADTIATMLGNARKGISRRGGKSMSKRALIKVRT